MTVNNTVDYYIADDYYYIESWTQYCDSNQTMNWVNHYKIQALI